MGKHTKDVGWGAPKHIQAEYIGEIEPPEEPRNITPKKYRYECKKLKGLHSWVVERIEEWEWRNGKIRYIHIKCSACGAKDCFNKDEPRKKFKNILEVTNDY